MGSESEESESRLERFEVQCRLFLVHLLAGQTWDIARKSATNAYEGILKPHFARVASVFGKDVEAFMSFISEFTRKTDEMAETCDLVSEMSRSALEERNIASKLV